MKSSKLSFALMALLFGTAIAGETLTMKPITYELRDAASHPISKGHESFEACFAAAPGPGDYLCIARVYGKIVENCDDAVKPALATFTIFDPNGVKYVIPEEPQDGVRILPDGTEYTFTDVGGLRAVEKPDGSWTSEEYILVLSPAPLCWNWQWKELTTPSN